jgi:hypothetical protein
LHMHLSIATLTVCSLLHIGIFSLLSQFAECCLKVISLLILLGIRLFGFYLCKTSFCSLWLFSHVECHFVVTETCSIIVVLSPLTCLVADDFWTGSVGYQNILWIWTQQVSLKCFYSKAWRPMKSTLVEQFLHYLLNGLSDWLPSGF